MNDGKEYSMQELSLDKVKSLQLDILKVIDSFCHRNNIRYSLAFGTLLGAVRHQGYIPWDDDLDIMMLREDYDVFVRTFSHPTYTVISDNKDNSYWLSFAKVIDTRTELYEPTTMKAKLGVYVDIFPVDSFPDTMRESITFCNEKKIWNAIHRIKILKVNNHRSLIKNVTLWLGKVVLSVIPMRFIIGRQQTIMTKYNNKGTSWVGVVCTDDNNLRWRMLRNSFDSFTPLLFEGLAYTCIADYHDFLSRVYGDYMQLPPEENRKSHHNFRAYLKKC